MLGPCLITLSSFAIIPLGERFGCFIVIAFLMPWFFTSPSRCRGLLCGISRSILNYFFYHGVLTIALSMFIIQLSFLPKIDLSAMTLRHKSLSCT